MTLFVVSEQHSLCLRRECALGSHRLDIDFEQPAICMSSMYADDLTV